MKDERIIEILGAVASAQPPVGNKRARLCAAVVYRGRIVAIGVNQDKTHPLARQYAKNEHADTLHAEVDAINRAAKKLNERQRRKSTVFVVRIKCIGNTQDGNSPEGYGLAKPCSGCMGMIEDYGFGRIVYTNDIENDRLSFTVQSMDN